jgi:hypothetical protein
LRAAVSGNDLTGYEVGEAVLDVRINGGGSDVFGIPIASRLATQEYLAYSKVVRNDIRDADHRVPPLGTYPTAKRRLWLTFSASRDNMLS